MSKTRTITSLFFVCLAGILVYGASRLYFMIYDSHSLTDNWPSIGSVEQTINIDPNLLELAEIDDSTPMVDPFYSRLTPFDFYIDWKVGDPTEGQLRPDVILHHYPYLTVANHYQATGTYVYYLPHDNIFYLWGDDWASHFDGMVGPFSGDPRIVLPQVAK